MEVLYERCAGLDVHQAQVTACIRVSSPDGKVWAQSRRFETLPEGLAELRSWLLQQAVTHVVMEGTGVYWLPVFTALEGPELDLTLANAHHVKNVPGRKTDQSDAAWLAQLLSCGLVRKSYVPPAAVRQLRELTRARVHRVEDRARVVNGMHRLLERVGLKLCSVVSDLQGATALAILTALVAGTSNPAALAALAQGRLREKKAELRAVLAVPLTKIDRFLLKQALDQHRQLDKQIAALDKQIVVQLQPYRAAYERLLEVPGIQEVSAAAILAELGPDVASFDDPHKLAAWAGLAPGQHESAGKRKKAGTRQGNSYLRRILVQTAFVLSRCKKGHDLTTFFRKKMPVLGFKKAAVATAHKLLVRLWYVLHEGLDYAPPAPPPPSEQQRTRATRRHLKALMDLGFEVVLQPKAA
jgi:transposase